MFGVRLLNPLKLKGLQSCSHNTSTKHQNGCHGRHRIAAKVILLRQSFSVKQDTIGEISMKNFKELGSKKKKFLISAGGILVITLIVILAATGLPKDGDSKANKVIQGNQDIQASDEAQTDDENKNAAEAAADDGKIHTLKSLLFAVQVTRSSDLMVLPFAQKRFAYHPIKLANRQNIGAVYKKAASVPGQGAAFGEYQYSLPAAAP